MGVDHVDRRTFLSTLGRCAGGACVACTVGGVLSDSASGKPPVRFQREVDHYEKLPGHRTKCFVCPLHCELNENETCFCRTRTNIGGKLFTRAYNNPSILSIDAIEKLPLNHFRPGSETLTLGTGGCNLRCIYCQNWQQSQKMPDEVKTFKLTPKDAVAAALERELDTIAFSYTEPVAFLEYALDIAKAAKGAGLRVVVATAGFIDPTPLLEFAPYVDAFAVSLKGFDGDFYQRSLGISLPPVLSAIETIKNKTGCWLELINLIVPTYNDDPRDIRRMAGWVRTRLDVNVPLHFARFVPEYKLKNLPRTPVQTLESARETALDVGLRYVYTSNIAPHAGTNTYCAKCGEVVIERLGFKVLDGAAVGGRCAACRRGLPGVWD